MGISESPSVPTPDDGGRDALGGASDAREACSACDASFAALDKHGIAYEKVSMCNWCKVKPADPSPDMDACCSLGCRYHLARDEGFVTDAEHEQYVAEGWVS